MTGSEEGRAPGSRQCSLYSLRGSALPQAPGWFLQQGPNFLPRCQACSVQPISAICFAWWLWRFFGSPSAQAPPCLLTHAPLLVCGTQAAFPSSLLEMGEKTPTAHRRRSSGVVRECEIRSQVSLEAGVCQASSALFLHPVLDVHLGGRRPWEVTEGQVAAGDFAKPELTAHRAAVLSVVTMWLHLF